MSAPPAREPAVAGLFYPAATERLDELVTALFEAADRLAGASGASGGRGGLPLGLLVPHAGLVYSGIPAAAAWASLPAGGAAPTVVLLGTNHGATWLRGVGVFERGTWSIPGSSFVVDAALAAEILALGPPFVTDAAAHDGEHSIEVQLPLLAAAAPGARIVPLAVACGTGDRAIEAGAMLGRLLGARRTSGDPVVLVISSDMAHYPDATTCDAVTERLLPAITALDARRLAADEAGVRGDRLEGVACGMCGIEPAVLGLAALGAMGAGRGTPLAASSSADAGGPDDRTVGYLAVRFDP